jgi:hypothetical protein
MGFGAIAAEFAGEAAGVEGAAVEVTPRSFLDAM